MKKYLFGCAIFLFKWFVVSIAQVYVKCINKSRHREIPAALKLPAFLCACFLVKGLRDFKSADEADADFFFRKHGDSLNDTVY